MIGRGVHELLAAGVLSLWSPVTFQVLGAALSARTFFALWAWVWFSMSVFGFSITWFILNFGDAAGNMARSGVGRSRFLPLPCCFSYCVP